MAPPKGTKKGSGSKDKENPLLKAAGMISKVLKEDDPTVTVDYNWLREPRPHIPTGSIVLDYLIGGRPNRYGVPPCPGWPRGAISNIYGHESSGKTTVALHAAAQVAKEGGTVCLIDWENAIDLTYAEGLGVPVDDPSRFMLVQPVTMEAGLVTLWAVANGGVDLIILDSVGAARPKEVVERSLEEQGKVMQVGLLARKWGDFLPQLAAVIAKTGSHVMGISQLRKKISTGPMASMGDGTTVQGGEAWKFYSSVRLKFQRIRSEKGKVYDALTHKVTEQMTSALIKCKVDKSKVSPNQQHEATYYIEFGSGIDDLRSVIEVACAHGVIKKAGAGWMAWERGSGETVKLQGVANLKQYLLETPGAREELTQRAMEVLRAASGSSVVTTLDEEEGGDELDLSLIMGGGKAKAFVSSDDDEDEPSDD